MIDDDSFFKDFDRRAGEMQNAAFKRWWWVITLNLAVVAAGLVFIAYLVKWVIS